MKMTSPPNANKRRRFQESPALFEVEGLSAVAEYIRYRPESIVRISSGKDTALAKLRQLTSDCSFDFSAVEDVGDCAAGLSVAATVRLDYLSELDFFHRIEGRQRDTILALDHITDPRNLGAIVRSAGFFGVKEVIIPERRQVLLTSASVATAQGGFALVDLVKCVNLGRFLTEMKSRGYWAIGADMGGEPIDILAGEYEKTILVMGSEGHGLSLGVRKKCDRFVAIPGAAKALESLNVSVAAGILMFSFCAQR